MYEWCDNDTMPSLDLGTSRPTNYVLFVHLSSASSGTGGGSRFSGPCTCGIIVPGQIETSMCCVTIWKRGGVKEGLWHEDRT